MFLSHKNQMWLSGLKEQKGTGTHGSADLPFLYQNTVLKYRSGADLLDGEWFRVALSHSTPHFTPK